ncbi:ERBB-3 BINDING PROTEIN 1-like, partial [Vicia villosa]|uniref:ERBB-3 BINDING PROTEIN 1-like n=1 Tax=Vicia villosa TaxID=3911 RepID=UPI00273AFB19
IHNNVVLLNPKSLRLSIKISSSSLHLLLFLLSSFSLFSLNSPYCPFFFSSKDLTSPDVVTKYKSAAEIANKALQLVILGCKPKVKVIDIWEKGDSFIREKTGNMYKNVKKKIDRGTLCTTLCISVNKDYYKMMEIDYDATDEDIRLNYRRLALKCHPDKHNHDTSVTAQFQQINEAYTGNSLIILLPLLNLVY